VSGALFVAHEDVPELGGVKQRVVGRQDRAAWYAEDGLDANGLQSHDEALGAGDLNLRRGYVSAPLAERTRQV
jgi:hypothetical protein